MSDNIRVSYGSLHAYHHIISPFAYQEKFHTVHKDLPAFRLWLSSLIDFYLFFFSGVWVNKMANRIEVIGWRIVWLLIFVSVSFPVALFCSIWYVLLLPFKACIKDMEEPTDLLLKAVQLPYFCIDNFIKKRTWREATEGRELLGVDMSTSTGI